MVLAPYFKVLQQRLCRALSAPRPAGGPLGTSPVWLAPIWATGVERARRKETPPPLQNLAHEILGRKIDGRPVAKFRRPGWRCELVSKRIQRFTVTPFSCGNRTGRRRDRRRKAMFFVMERTNQLCIISPWIWRTVPKADESIKKNPYRRTRCLTSLSRKLPTRLPRLRRIRSSPASTKYVSRMLSRVSTSVPTGSAECHVLSPTANA